MYLIYLAIGRSRPSQHTLVTRDTRLVTKVRANRDTRHAPGHQSASRAQHATNGDGQRIIKAQKKLKKKYVAGLFLKRYLFFFLLSSFWVANGVVLKDHSPQNVSKALETITNLLLIRLLRRFTEISGCN